MHPYGFPTIVTDTHMDRNAHVGYATLPLSGAYGAPKKKHHKKKTRKQRCLGLLKHYERLVLSGKTKRSAHLEKKLLHVCHKTGQLKHAKAVIKRLHASRMGKSKVDGVAVHPELQRVDALLSNVTESAGEGPGDEIGETEDEVDEDSGDLAGIVDTVKATVGRVPTWLIVTSAVGVFLFLKR